jgi:hypothetical protein
MGLAPLECRLLHSVRIMTTICGRNVRVTRCGPLLIIRRKASFEQGPHHNAVRGPLLEHTLRPQPVTNDVRRLGVWGREPESVPLLHKIVCGLLRLLAAF